MGIMGLAGQDQQGNFSKEQRKLAVDEIKRAIEFASDTAGGGSVVVHSGEFQRPISEEEWAKEGDKHIFKQYEDEPEKAVIRVVDQRTGQVMDTVRKNRKVSRPKWNRAEEEYDHTITKDNKDLKQFAGDTLTVKQGQYIDYEGNPLAMKNRVPEYDYDEGKFQVEYYTFDKFEDEAKERNEHIAKQKGLTVEQLKMKYPDEYVLPEEAFIHATLETNAANSRGWAYYYGAGFEKYAIEAQKARESLKFYEKLEKELPKDELFKIMTKDPIIQRMGDLVPDEMRLPSEILKFAIKESEHHMQQAKEASTSQWQQAADADETKRNIVSARKYALNESINSYAESGMHALYQTRDKKNPLFISIENIFPESYGAHPKELRALVDRSRNKMAETLQKQHHVNPEEARKLSREHIKATLDTGHLNTWRKYWQGDDQSFKKWLVTEVDKLAKDKIIGNVHLADNMGYQDDHLAPGQGTTPIREILTVLKKHGYNKALTVEPGADASTDLGDFWGLMKTWRHIGAPVYGIGSGASGARPPQKWGDIQHSYFGQNKPPHYIFGAYSPSEDWTLWSEVPFE